MMKNLENNWWYILTGITHVGHVKALCLISVITKLHVTAASDPGGWQCLLAKQYYITRPKHRTVRPTLMCQASQVVPLVMFSLKGLWKDLPSKAWGTCEGGLHLAILRPLGWKLQCQKYYWLLGKHWFCCHPIGLYSVMLGSWSAWDQI